jgi:dTDP-4-amino-4,6-dideoxygalactose transaminase
MNYKKITIFFKENPNAKLIHEQGLYFGNNPDMTKKEIDRIVSIFLE